MLNPSQKTLYSEVILDIYKLTTSLETGWPWNLTQWTQEHWMARHWKPSRDLNLKPSENSFYQQQKNFQQIRSRQSHSLKALTQANEKFLKGMENLEKDMNSVLSSVQREFKKQMVFLQSKITDG
ncbi:synaptonemal complex protein 3-like [Arvicanthis niloticus]|uniref:synaptonemal complex protein 3-like n=1 Tax=Arvicanthis niloticus TaxID=61156 RepID=UPI00402B583A